MAQHSFCNAFKLIIKAKQKKWKQSLRKKFAWLKTKDNSKLLHVRDLDTTTTTTTTIKRENYPTLRRIRPARRRFPIDDSSGSDFEEDLATESSSSPLDKSSSSKVYDVPPSCQNSCSTTSASQVFPPSSSSSPETQTDHSNVPLPETPSTSDTLSSGPGRPSSFRSSTCTSSMRDSYVTAVSYLDSAEDEVEDDGGNASIIDTRSDTPSAYTSIFESQDSESGTCTTSVSSISC